MKAIKSTMSATLLNGSGNPSHCTKYAAPPKISNATTIEMIINVCEW